jgi:uncharacterized protein YkwD
VRRGILNKRILKKRQQWRARTGFKTRPFTSFPAPVDPPQTPAPIADPIPSPDLMQAPTEDPGLSTTPTENPTTESPSEHLTEPSTETPTVPLTEPPSETPIETPTETPTEDLTSPPAQPQPETPTETPGGPPPESPTNSPSPEVPLTPASPAQTTGRCNHPWIAGSVAANNQYRASFGAGPVQCDEKGSEVAELWSQEMCTCVTHQ